MSSRYVWKKFTCTTTYELQSLSLGKHTVYIESPLYVGTGISTSKESDTITLNNPELVSQGSRNGGYICANGQKSDKVAYGTFSSLDVSSSQTKLDSCSKFYMGPVKNKGQSAGNVSGPSQAPFLQVFFLLFSPSSTPSGSVFRPW